MNLRGNSYQLRDLGENISNEDRESCIFKSNKLYANACSSNNEGGQLYIAFTMSCQGIEGIRELESVI